MDEEKAKLLKLMKETRDSGSPEEFQQLVNQFQSKFGNPAMKGGRELFDSRLSQPVVKGIIDKVDTKDVQKVISGSDFVEKIASLRALKKLGKLGKSVPVLGTLAGVATGLASGDASAAIPVLNEADDLGAGPDTLEGKLERGEINLGDFMKARQQNIPKGSEVVRESELINNFNKPNTQDGKSVVRESELEQKNRFNKLKGLMGK